MLLTNGKLGYAAHKSERFEDYVWQENSVTIRIKTGDYKIDAWYDTPYYYA
jgi:hypothetical protein